jgi:hypothetical protein
MQACLLLQLTDLTCTASQLPSQQQLRLLVMFYTNQVSWDCCHMLDQSNCQPTSPEMLLFTAGLRCVVFITHSLCCVLFDDCTNF